MRAEDKKMLKKCVAVVTILNLKTRSSNSPTNDQCDGGGSNSKAKIRMYHPYWKKKILYVMTLPSEKKIGGPDITLKKTILYVMTF